MKKLFLLLLLLPLLTGAGPISGGPISGSGGGGDAVSLHVDDLITLSGMPEGSQHLGAFSGTTIPDNQTSKAAIQALETAVEMKAAINASTTGSAGSLLSPASELTIASDAITVTGGAHTVDTESDAASDDLVTINGGADGKVIFLRASHTDRTVVLKETGNIVLTHGTTLTLDSTGRWVMLYYDGNLSKWVCDALTDTLSLGELTLGGVILGDSSPDASGELGFASNQLSVHDGTASRSLLQVASTEITKTEYIPIAYAEDGAAAPAAASVWADTRKAKVRVFAADADDDVEIHWMVPLDYSGGIKFRVIGFVDNATAPANTETVIFNLAGCSVGNSDDGGCTLGTGVDATFTADATYAQHDRWSTAYSTEVTVTNIAAGESVMLKLSRDVDDTYGQGIGVAGIEIKYKAKINAVGDY